MAELEPQNEPKEAQEAQKVENPAQTAVLAPNQPISPDLKVDTVPVSVLTDRLAVKTAKNQEQERTIAELTSRLEKGKVVTIEQLQAQMEEDRAKQEAFVAEVAQERVLVSLQITNDKDQALARWAWTQDTAEEPMPFDVWLANRGKDNHYVGPLLAVKPAPSGGSERGPLVHTNGAGASVLDGLSTQSVAQRTSDDGRKAFWGEYNKDAT